MLCRKNLIQLFLEDGVNPQSALYGMLNSAISVLNDAQYYTGQFEGDETRNR